MNRRLYGHLTRFASLLLILAPTASFATDGVVLINQSNALAGNVTPGDAAGFPVTISRPGSYRLSSRLTAPQSTRGIVITANNVSLDLNGFLLVGNTSCCSIGGISAGTKTRISVRNGLVAGFAIGINLFNVTAATVENMNVETTGNGAVYTGTGSLVRGNIFGGTISFQITCPGVVVDNVFPYPGGNNGFPTATCAKANNLNF